MDERDLEKSEKQDQVSFLMIFNMLWKMSVVCGKT